MERCGFFNANLVGEEYDRVYLAQHFAAYFASFIGNGVFAEHSNKLQVVEMEYPQMQVKVMSGQAWINGYWYENTDAINLSIDAADGVLNRFDSVVLRLGLAERNMWLVVKKGTPATNPLLPEVTRTADYYELQLAVIRIPAGSIKITQAQITDTRMYKDVCGWVTGVVKQLDTTTLASQFESYFDEFKRLSASEFDTWFESVKGKLSGDIAGSLQNQIDNLDMQLSNQLANIGKTVYPVGSIYISVTDTSPASLFGGTWERLKDKFLLAAGDSYAAGSTGGEAAHKLTTDEMPVHSHGLNNHTHGIPSLSGSTETAGWHNHSIGATNNDGSISVSGVQLQWASSAFSGGGIGGIRAWSSESGRQTIRVHVNGHSTDGNGSHTHSVSTNTSTTGGNSGNTTNTGSGTAHNNMPPYLAVYAWKRVE